MRTKLMAIIVLGFMLMASAAWCMPGGGPEGPPGFLPPHILDALDLDEDQFSDIETIRSAYESQIDTLRMQMMDTQHEINTLLFADTFDESALRSACQAASSNMEEMQVLNGKMIVEIKAVLTAEQFATLQELIQEPPKPPEPPEAF